MSSTPAPATVSALLKKAEHYDKDERYMATNDLMEILKKHSARDSIGATTGISTATATLDPATERRICSTVLRLLHDKSNDVQAIAVKTLGVLLTTVKQEQVLEINDSLTDQVLDVTKNDLRDVYAIGLRTLVKTTPQSMGNDVCNRLGKTFLALLFLLFSVRLFLSVPSAIAGVEIIIIIILYTMHSRT